MPSEALIHLQTRLTDVDEVLLARDAICAPGVGRPAQRRGAAVLRSAAVLLSAAFEGYMETLYNAAVDLLFAAYPVADRNALKNSTSERNHNANVFKVNALYFNIGIPWVMHHPNIHWRKFPNDRVRETLNELSTARNQIAHGQLATVRKPTARKWRDFVGRLATRLDEIVADKVEADTGVRPW